MIRQNLSEIIWVLNTKGNFYFNCWISHSKITNQIIWSTRILNDMVLGPRTFNHETLICIIMKSKLNICLSYNPFQISWIFPLRMWLKNVWTVGFATYVSYLGAEAIDSENLPWGRLLVEETFRVGILHLLNDRNLGRIFFWNWFLLFRFKNIFIIWENHS